MAFKAPTNEEDSKSSDFEFDNKEYGFTELEVDEYKENRDSEFEDLSLMCIDKNNTKSV